MRTLLSAALLAAVLLTPAYAAEEGWIAQQGGFERLPSVSVEELLYIRLSGGDPT